MTSFSRLVSSASSRITISSKRAMQIFCCPLRARPTSVSINSDSSRICTLVAMVDCGSSNASLIWLTLSGPRRRSSRKMRTRTGEAFPARQGSRVSGCARSLETRDGARAPESLAAKARRQQARQSRPVSRCRTGSPRRSVAAPRRGIAPGRAPHCARSCRGRSSAPRARPPESLPAQEAAHGVGERARSSSARGRFPRTPVEEVRTRSAPWLPPVPEARSAPSARSAPWARSVQ